jgi:Mn2+/Fe2+ NRAMP family transporter
MSGTSLTPGATLSAASRLRRFLAVFGPGLVVMLADTDVGSVITAGQSGVQWSCRLHCCNLFLFRSST